jgi:hypothetical protein
MSEAELDALSLPTGSQIAYDTKQQPVVLFANEWSANYFGQTNPKTPLSPLPLEPIAEGEAPAPELKLAG